jgi:hypothetical protein
MAAGMMYIANSFKTVERTVRARGGWPVDNDPHFWSSPPTWGICRNDLRKKAKPGQTIFFVLSKYAQQPQMIFGYIKIKEIVTHAAAYRKLPHKRMGPAIPNGNIIVDAAGRYNRWDGGTHYGIFDKVRRRYAIGNASASRFLTAEQIHSKAPEFIPRLKQILSGDGTRAIDFITRAGCHALSEEQVQGLRSWIDENLSDTQRGFGGEVATGVQGARCGQLRSACGAGGVCAPVRVRRKKARRLQGCGSEVGGVCAR